MYALVRPLLFALDPATAHALGMAVLAPLERWGALRTIARALFVERRPRLVTKTMGLTFPSPIGLAAGFDKNARRARALAALGFGHVELGTVTAIGQEPNPPPNLFRLPRDRALVNRLGFPNDGASAVMHRLRALGGARAIGVPVGVSIGKSRSVGIEPLAPAVEDYVASFRAAREEADFVVVNVSSPNTRELRALQGAELARELLSALVHERASGRRVPLLVKVAPDLADAELSRLLDVILELGLEGVVATNTTVARADLVTPADEIRGVGAGGLSGPPLKARALEVVSMARARLGPRATVIGVGGIETADDVLAFAAAGADLVQLYTGFVYGGPLVASRLARDVDERLMAMGASHLRELVGTATARED